ncbi:MAG: MBL fold metallo-hydrolase [Janthinobacterium lividum]
MEFQTLSHAGLRVAAGGVELVCDPWLVGSVYWRSWWNYPPVPRTLVESLRPDFIYLTHLHWDHFQADSLRLFPADTPILVPYDRYERMTRDLKAVGRTNVREVRHGERIVLGPQLAVTSFHFSPIITDSALVIEAGDQVLFNANDAKFAGLPLDQILKRFPRIDFCFRSHSSANPRACYHVTDAPDEETDDNEHYVRAFALFMARVKPRYAIPFASNSCLLHDDVFDMNALVQTPSAVRDYFETFRRERGLDSQVQIMTPGDRWSTERGFELQGGDWFDNRDQRIAEYRDRVAPTMAKQAALEARVSVPVKQVERFFADLTRKVPALFMRPLKGREVLLVGRSEKRVDGFAVDLPAGTVRQVDPAEFDGFDMRIEFPALVLRQSVAMNMFGHAGISKRVHYHATAAAMPALKRFVTITELAEAEVFPLRSHLSLRAIRAMMPRWREGVLYARVVADLARGRDLPAIEERYLDPLAA